MSERQNKRARQSKAPSEGASAVNIRSIISQASSDVTAEVEYDQNNPIPLELENVFGFSPGGNKFIPFFNGTDSFYGYNAFFINILKGRLESNTLNSCIVSKTKYTIGDGIFISNGVDREGKKDPLWTDFKARANVDGKSFNTVLKEIINTLNTFGNCCIEIVKGEIGGKRFLFVYCKNILDCRKSWPDENNVSNAVVISRWFRSPKVLNLTQRFNIRIPFYRSGLGNKTKYWLQDAMAKSDPDKEGSVLVGDVPSPGIKVWRTAIWMKDDFPGYDHYGLPTWLPALLHGKLENEGANYNLDMFNNNMNPGGMMLMNGSLSQPELDTFSRKLNKQYIQKGEKGKILFVQSEEGKGSYTPFPTQKEGSYIELSKYSSEELISANEWDGALIGKTEKGTLGKGGSFLKELYQQKIKTVIKPRQKQIKDEFLIPLCEIADSWLGTNWGSFDLDIAISDIFDDTTDASTTVTGITAFMGIVKLVSTGSWPLKAAIKFVAEKYGVDEKTSKEWLGDIVVTPPTNKNETE